jgi:hypothetical protein
MIGIRCIETHLIELYIEDYCKEIESFINFSLSNSKNISRGWIKYPCVKGKNKKFTPIRCCDDAYLCWYVHAQLCISYKTMLKMIVGWTSNSKF